MTPVGLGGIVMKACTERRGARTVRARGARRPVLLALLMLVALSLPVAANHPPVERAQMLRAGAIGPYSALITAAPTPVVAGRVSIGVSLQAPARGFEHVTGADVTVTVVSPSGGQPLSQKATHDQATDPRDYAAFFVMNEPGEWEIAIHVDGPEGEADAKLTLDVQPRRYTSLIIACAALVGSVVAYVKWGQDP